MKRAFYRYFIIGYGNNIPILKFVATLPDDPLADSEGVLAENYRFIFHLLFSPFMICKYSVNNDLR